MIKLKTNQPWAASDVQFLKQHPHMKSSRVAKKLGRTEKAVEQRRHKLRVAAREVVAAKKTPSNPNPKLDLHCYSWTFKDETKLRKLWADPALTLLDIAIALARSPGGVYVRANTVLRLERTRPYPTPKVMQEYKQLLNFTHSEPVKTNIESIKTKIKSIKTKVKVKAVTPVVPVYKYEGKHNIATFNKLGWFARTLLGVRAA